MVNKNTEQLKEYIDEKVSDIQRPGGLNYYNTDQQSRSYQAVVSLNRSGGAFDDLGEAIRYVETNYGQGKILVNRGTYILTNEDINITKDNIEIYGEDRDNTVVKVSDNNTYFADLVNITANNTLISNITFDGNRDNNTGTTILVNFTSGTGLVLDRVNLINQSGITGAGVKLPYDSKSYIGNCIAQNCDGVGFNGSYSGFTTMSYCKAETCGTGFSLWSYSVANGCIAGSCDTGFETTSVRTLISNSSTLGCGTGIFLKHMENTVNGCIINDSTVHGIRLDVGFNSITGNVIRNSGSSQIIATGANSFNSCISSNTIVGGSSHGIELYNTYYHTITGNFIRKGGTVDLSDCGVIMRGTARSNNITGNTIDGANGTINFAYAVREDTTSDGTNLIVGNILQGAGTQVGTQSAASIVANNLT